jgi:hypothetical protein
MHQALRHFDLQTGIGLALLDDLIVAADEFFERIAALVSVESRPFKNIPDEELDDVEHFDSPTEAILLRQALGKGSACIRGDNERS